jgi:hypothetical protein
VSEPTRLLNYDEVRAIELHEQDEIAQVIFEQCYQRNPNVEHSWNSAQYAAPETQTGWAARNAQHCANEIRLRFLCTPV